MRIGQKKKIALVLSGGGIKAAAFHIGVAMALQEKGFRFAGGTDSGVKQHFDPEDPMVIRTYVGSSAGAFVASVLASGYPIEALIEAFKVGTGQFKADMDNDTSFLKPLSYRSIFNLNSTSLLKFIPRSFMEKALVTGGLEAVLKNGLKLNGLFSTKGLEAYLRKDVLPENDFAKLGVELFIIGTQLNHSRKVIFGGFDEVTKTETTKYVNYASISQAVAASTALPPVFAPYGIVRPDGREMYYYDGEIRDTLSTHVAADHGADLVISSYSTQPYHYTDEMGSLHNYGIPVIANQALYQVIQQKITRHIQGQRDIKEIYDTIEEFFLKNNLPMDKCQELLNIYSKKLNYRKEVDYIYISPRAQNYEMFFVDHFSLNPKILERIVRIGFKSGIGVLRHYQI